MQHEVQYRVYPSQSCCNILGHNRDPSWFARGSLFKMSSYVLLSAHEDAQKGCLSAAFIPAVKIFT